MGLKSWQLRVPVGLKKTKVNNLCLGLVSDLVFLWAWRGQRSPICAWETCLAFESDLVFLWAKVLFCLFSAVLTWLEMVDGVCWWLVPDWQALLSPPGDRSKSSFLASIVSEGDITEDQFQYKPDFIKVEVGEALRYYGYTEKKHSKHLLGRFQ